MTVHWCCWMNWELVRIQRRSCTGNGFALQWFHQRGCRTIATIHYSELKVFAYTTEGLANASVQFDVATLRPTYKLEIGLPGRSNAFAIASRLGLRDDVIEAARAHLTKEDIQIDDLIQDMERK